MDAVVFHQLCTIYQHLGGNIIYGPTLENTQSNQPLCANCIHFLYSTFRFSVDSLPLAVSDKRELKTVCPHETWMRRFTCFINIDINHNFTYKLFNAINHLLSNGTSVSPDVFRPSVLYQILICKNNLTLPVMWLYL